jgi:hypothetical protein
LSSVAGWTALAAELREWRRTGHRADFWWRDDDASSRTPTLERLLALSRKSGVPLAVAAVPLAWEGPMPEQDTCLIMHGCDHRNRAAPGEKKTEFPAAERDDAALERLAQAREKLAHLAGARFIPVLAPPWNRFRESLVSRLREAGLRGLSRYGPRRSPGTGLLEVNTHVDIVAWRRDRGFVGDEEALDMVVRHLAARRRGAVDPAEPTGLLTHHALHDAQAWGFLERLFDESRAAGAAWLSPVQVFTSTG